MNNEMIPGLFDAELGITQSEQTLFDYEQVPVDRRGFVLQKTAEIQWLLKRTSDDILRIGQFLIEVKDRLPHGMFGRWIESEFEMSPSNARNYMSIAHRFGGKTPTVGVLNMGLGLRLLTELATAPDEVIDQVVVGDIPPTKEAIKEAKLEARMAKLEAARSKAEAQAAQLQLFNNQDAAQKEIDALTKQMEALKQELETATTPEVQIVEVEKEVLPESAKNTLEELQGKIDKLNADLEAEKAAIPPDVQKKLDNLQKQADKLKRQEDENKLQQERIDRLNNELRAAVRDSIASENDERIRQDWRTINSEVRSCLMRLLGQWPTPLDVRSFESDDWERLSQLKATLKRVLEECDNLHYSGDDMVVDDTGVEAPMAYIEAPSVEPPSLFNYQSSPAIIIGIPPEYQSLFDEYEQALLNSTRDLQEWATNEEGYIWQPMSAEKHIGFTRELLSSRVDRRIRAALSAMKIALGTETVSYAWQESKSSI